MITKKLLFSRDFSYVRMLEEIREKKQNQVEFNEQGKEATVWSCKGIIISHTWNLSEMTVPMIQSQRNVRCLATENKKIT